MIEITIPFPPYLPNPTYSGDLVLPDVKNWKEVSSKSIEKDGEKRIFHTIDFYPDSFRYKQSICCDNYPYIIFTDEQYKELKNSFSIQKNNKIIITSEWDDIDKDFLNSDFLKKWLI